MQAAAREVGISMGDLRSAVRSGLVTMGMSPGEMKAIIAAELQGEEGLALGRGGMSRAERMSKRRELEA